MTRVENSSRENASDSERSEHQGFAGCSGFFERKTSKICPGVQNVVCQTGMVWSLTCQEAHWTHNPGTEVKFPRFSHQSLHDASLLGVDLSVCTVRRVALHWPSAGR